MLRIGFQLSHSLCPTLSAPEDRFGTAGPEEFRCTVENIKIVEALIKNEADLTEMIAQR